MQLPLTVERGRNKPAPLYRQIADQVESLIDTRALSEGARLPTVRSLAESLAVTAVTVQSAYSELQDRGLVNAVVGRGTFVRHRPPADPAELVTRSRTTHEVLRDLARFEQVPGVFPMAQGNGGASLRPAAAFMRCFKALEAEAQDLLGYWAPQGCAGLRAEVTERLGRRGVSARPDDLVLTQGVTQALDLLMQVLCRPGDQVLVETPTYLGMLGLLQLQEVTPIGVPLDDEGPDLDAMERVLRSERPRFLYTVAAYHNPTGRSMSLARRLALLELAERYDLLVIEDDIYRDIILTDESPPPLASLATPGRVVYVDGFGKSLMPGIRAGYILPPRSLRGPLVDAHRLRTLCGPTLMQAALAEFLRRGEMEAHLKRVLPIFRRRRRALLESLAAEMPPGVEWTDPAGGYCVWLTMPEDPRGSDVFAAAIREGVATAPGEHFLVHPDGHRHLRLSIGGIEEEQIPAAIARLGRAIEGTLSGSDQGTAAELVPLV